MDIYNRIICIQYETDFYGLTYKEVKLDCSQLEYQITKWNDVVGSKYNHEMIKEFEIATDKILSKIKKLEQLCLKVEFFSPYRLEYKSIREEIEKYKVNL